MYLSSSAVKELAMFGADLSAFAPREIIGEIEAKYKQERTDSDHGKRDQ
jgi:phosphopantetheine adenylyltransferase